MKLQPTFVEELLPWMCQAPKITTYRVNLLKTTLGAFTDRIEQLLAEKYPHKIPSVFTIGQIPEILCIGTVDGDALSSNLNPTELKQVIVDTCCGAALLRGAHIYAPGVLAMEAGTRLHENVAIYADLEGKCKRGTNKRYESVQKLFIGYGLVRMQRYQIYGEDAARTGIAVEMETNISGVPAIGDLSSTEALLQNLPSIVCVRVLDPKPGEVVLDMCAAPGNKTTHIAELMQDKGILVALDKTESKIRHVRDKVQRYGLHSIRPYAYDATKAFKENDATLTDSDLEPPFAAATFDRILLDAPCSALGNRPLLSSRGLTHKMLQSYPNVQRKLLSTAVQLLKPGGILVYSTCTITDAENEGMVKWALDKYPQLQLIEATPRLGSAGLPELGLNELQW